MSLKLQLWKCKFIIWFGNTNSKKYYYEGRSRSKLKRKWNMNIYYNRYLTDVKRTNADDKQCIISQNAIVLPERNAKTTDLEKAES